MIFVRSISSYSGAVYSSTRGKISVTSVNIFYVLSKINRMTFSGKSLLTRDVYGYILTGVASHETVGIAVRNMN